MTSSATTTNSSDDNNPWGWLGLLKWSLGHCDGPSSGSSENQVMSEEDKKFLERVMKDGIVDENERMKEILEHAADRFDSWRRMPPQAGDVAEVEGVLQELRDIVEQIDYARAFCSLGGGLPFLLGCVSSSSSLSSDGDNATIPRSIKTICLGILSTLCQNNPPVQSRLAESGAIEILSDLFFFQHQQQQQQEEVVDDAFCARIVQAISAVVRSHPRNERLFLRSERSRELLELGLGMNHFYSATAPFPFLSMKRTLFFFKALITSDYCDNNDNNYHDDDDPRGGENYSTQQFFDPFLAYIIDNYVLPPGGCSSSSSSIHDDNNNEDEIREMSVSLLHRLLEQNRYCDTIVTQRKGRIIVQAHRRIRFINALPPERGDDREFAAVELECWEHILRLLEGLNTTTTTGATAPPSPPPPVLLLGTRSEARHDILPQ